MVHGICEGMWLRRLLNDLGIRTIEPISMCWDNQTVIRIARNPVHRDQTKHMESDRHFIKEKLDGKIVDLQYTSTHHQIAEVLTKALSQTMFVELSCNLGMINIYHPA